MLDYNYYSADCGQSFTLPS